MYFEEAAIRSLKNVFPSVQILGCNYHFNQCVWRKIQELGMIHDYTNKEEVRLHVRICAALAYVPVTDVENGWLCIMEDSPNHHQQLQKFQDYLVDQWIQNSNITVDMWNCYEQRHRTNNAVEGWNHRLNSILKKPHPTLFALIKCLKTEAEYSNFLYDKINLNIEGKRRKRAYIKHDERIARTLGKYKETGDLKKCLQTLAYIQKLE